MGAARRGSANASGERDAAKDEAGAVLPPRLLEALAVMADGDRREVAAVSAVVTPVAWDDGVGDLLVELVTAGHTVSTTHLLVVCVTLVPRVQGESFELCPTSGPLTGEGEPNRLVANAPNPAVNDGLGEAGVDDSGTARAAGAGVVFRVNANLHTP
jgi:hypothetical protein